MNTSAVTAEVAELEKSSVYFNIGKSVTVECRLGEDNVTQFRFACPSCHSNLRYISRSHNGEPDAVHCDADYTIGQTCKAARNSLDVLTKLRPAVFANFAYASPRKQGMNVRSAPTWLAELPFELAELLCPELDVLSQTLFLSALESDLQSTATKLTSQRACVLTLASLFWARIRQVK